MLPGMGTIALTEKQQRRAEILSRLCEGGTTSEQASHLLGVCVRQVRRLRLRFVAEGPASLVHANTGRAPANKTPESVRRRLIELVGNEGRYHDVNTSHLQELLAEQEGIRISRSALDRLLCQDGVRQRRRDRRRRVFQRPERCGREGEARKAAGDGS